MMDVADMEGLLETLKVGCPNAAALTPQHNILAQHNTCCPAL